MISDPNEGGNPQPIVDPIAFPNKNNQLSSKSPILQNKRSELDAESRSCPGYILEFKNGVPAAAHYPFSLHMTQSFPWVVTIIGTSVTLFSEGCSKNSRAPRNTSITNTRLPCTSCANLDNHSIIMGIRARALDGAYESTPWGYLGAAHLLGSLERKTRQIDELRLNALNTSRKLTVRNRHLDSWKRLVLAISKGNVSRIHSLLQTAQGAGRGVFGILEKVDEASRHVYTPKSYEEADYQRAFLFWKLGGRAAANIAHHALGVPSIDTAQNHIQTTPLIASPGMPTLDEIKKNVAICVSGKTSHSDDEVSLGVTMQIDEIKLRECLRWDPTTNNILGVCREHGHHCVLEFRTQTQADRLLKCLQDDEVHFASEVRHCLSL